jgi:hypothetical protein
MPLNWGQMEKVNNYFRLNGVVSDCPYCSTHGWEVGELISAAVVDEQGNELSESVVMAQFSCSNCGHISLFDARRIGLLSS